ncbi:hypothetical protein DY000_02020388 [Brassica cretica]|uniref:Extensin domain-containing protein n=1 Tax=Brassica cretica TaxID=69181 RepID=A0ABQ7EJA0_BRACR|nr:hypothetical protein DY000_02020388 [Brassica cretica]
MAIKSTSFTICLLFSLATIATAYYSPSSPPVHQSPAYTHKPTLPPPVYTPPVYKPTFPPPVYTKPTLPPPVYTPPVYKPTLPPPVYKKSPSYSPPSYVLKIVEPDHRENLELDGTRAGTSWNASWNELERTRAEERLRAGADRMNTSRNACKNRLGFVGFRLGFQNKSARTVSVREGASVVRSTNGLH